jgi:multidrug resistance efflux pump
MTRAQAMTAEASLGQARAQLAQAELNVRGLAIPASRD